jgi:hypothetical protein
MERLLSKDLASVKNLDAHTFEIVVRSVSATRMRKQINVHADRSVRDTTLFGQENSFESMIARVPIDEPFVTPRGQIVSRSVDLRTPE